MAGASGADVLAGIVAGYEVACRVALALPARAHYERGFHPTATCGAFGAAAAAGRVLGLDAAGIEVGARHRAQPDRGQPAVPRQRRLDQALPGRLGGDGAGWSRRRSPPRGSVGAGEALEGRHGFLRAYAPDPEPERAVQELGRGFELMRTGVKPYPSCRYGHAGIDAALALRAAHALRAGEIDSVTYGLSQAGMLLVGAPAERKADPQNVVDAQFSGPFVIACALATGAMEWDSLPAAARPRDPGADAEGALRARCRRSRRWARWPAGSPSTARGETFSRDRGGAERRAGELPRHRRSARQVRRAGHAGDGAGTHRAAGRAVLAMDTLADIARLTRLGTPVLSARLAG